MGHRSKTDAGITYNAGTGMFTATGFTGPLTGTADVAGCAIKDHTKATVSSFHLGGSLTWSF